MTREEERNRSGGEMDRRKDEKSREEEGHKGRKKNTHMFTYAGPISEPRAALPMLI